MHSTVKRLGELSNKYSSLIASIPGTFYLFRIIYNFLYPVDNNQLTKNVNNEFFGPLGNKILIVSPQSCSNSNVPWEPAEGNYFYDIWQSANERYGADKVLLFQINPNDVRWSDSLLEFININKPHSIIFQGEEDPNNDQDSWINFAAKLKAHWNGKLIFLMYDSVYWWHIFKAEKISKIYENTSVHAIDRFPKEAKVRHKSGPGILPTSRESLFKLTNNPKWSEKNQSTGKLTFIGSLYPKRISTLKKFEKKGIEISINPHRLKNNKNKPKYFDYAASISQSWATLNLSRNHGMPVKHMKTRVLEAPLFGTILFSDEKKLASKVLPENAFVYFKNSSDLRDKISFLRANSEIAESIRIAGMNKAYEIANSNFWEAIENPK